MCLEELVGVRLMNILSHADTVLDQKEHKVLARRVFFSFFFLQYLVEAASSWVFLAGPELLQLSIQDIHELLHQAHRGADVSGKHRALCVACQLIG